MDRTFEGHFSTALGNALLTASRPEEADAEYRRALAISPDRASAWGLLRSLLLRGDHAGASQVAVEWLPQYADVLRAGIDVLDHQAVPSADVCERARLLASQSPYFHFWSAILASGCGLHESAHAELSRFLTWYPPYPAWAWMLMSWEWTTGETLLRHLCKTRGLPTPVDPDVDGSVEPDEPAVEARPAAVIGEVNASSLEDDFDDDCQNVLRRAAEIAAENGRECTWTDDILEALFEHRAFMERTDLDTETISANLSSFQSSRPAAGPSRSLHGAP